MICKLAFYVRKKDIMDLYIPFLLHLKKFLISFNRFPHHYYYYYYSTSGPDGESHVRHDDPRCIRSSWTSISSSGGLHTESHPRTHSISTAWLSTVIPPPGLLFCPPPPWLTRWLNHIVSNGGAGCETSGSIFPPGCQSTFVRWWVTWLNY